MSESNTLNACLLIYDIPERAPVANPSGRLRPIAVRVNLSCWVIREGDIPYTLMHTMAEGGATWHVVRFDAAEGAKLVGMAVEALKRDLRDALRRARRAADRAAEQLDAPTGSRGRYDEQSRVIVRRARKLLNDVRSAATRFGITEDSLTLASAADAVNAIQAGMRTRAALYVAAQADLRRIGDSALANAAALDLVPAGIVADRIEDTGADASALRAAFEDAAA